MYSHIFSFGKNDFEFFFIGLPMCSLAYERKSHSKPLFSSLYYSRNVSHSINKMDHSLVGHTLGFCYTSDYLISNYLDTLLNCSLVQSPRNVYLNTILKKKIYS